MAEDLLRSVIELEKSIQRQLTEEQRRASAWLEQERRCWQQRLDAERQRLAGDEDASAHIAWERLQARLRRHEAQQLACLERFRCLSEVRLPELLAVRLAEILPGEGHDHQDVES